MDILIFVRYSMFVTLYPSYVLEHAIIVEQNVHQTHSTHVPPHPPIVPQFNSSHSLIVSPLPSSSSFSSFTPWPIIHHSAVHAVVVAAGAHHNVPAGVAVHDRGARLLADDVLRARRAARTDAADDQNVQQWGACSE